jgi:DNA-3-methyladenine glycosylase II
MTPEAIHHLSQRDKKLAKLISKIGPMKLELDSKMNPFQSLVQAIVYQQLHGKAAATIFKRVKALFPRRRFPKPEDFLSTSLAKLRSAGLSEAKAKAIQDLSKKTLEGTIPPLKKILKLSDEEIIQRLTQVKGVGPWTVEMLLIFKLGRPNVLPSTDFAIRKAISLLYSLKEMPTPKKVLEIGEIWKPYRTTASWYLWRSLDTSK